MTKKTVLQKILIALTCLLAAPAWVPAAAVYGMFAPNPTATGTLRITRSDTSVDLVGELIRGGQDAAKLIPGGTRVNMGSPCELFEKPVATPILDSFDGGEFRITPYRLYTIQVENFYCPSGSREVGKITWCRALYQCSDTNDPNGFVTLTNQQVVMMPPEGTNAMGWTNSNLLLSFFCSAIGGDDCNGQAPITVGTNLYQCFVPRQPPPFWDTNGSLIPVYIKPGLIEPIPTNCLPFSLDGLMPLHMHCTFEPQPGYGYVLQYRYRLDSTNWTTCSDELIPPDTNTCEIDILNLPYETKFFRLVQIDHANYSPERIASILSATNDPGDGVAYVPSTDTSPCTNCPSVPPSPGLMSLNALSPSLSAAASLYEIYQSFSNGIPAFIYPPGYVEGLEARAFGGETW